jgi:predicted metal-binding protein
MKKEFAGGQRGSSLSTLRRRSVGKSAFDTYFFFNVVAFLTCFACRGSPVSGPVIHTKTLGGPRPASCAPPHLKCLASQRRRVDWVGFADMRSSIAALASMSTTSYVTQPIRYAKVYYLRAEPLSGDGVKPSGQI